MAFHKILKTLITIRLIGSATISILISHNASALPDGYDDHYHDGMRYGLFIPPSYDSTRNYPLIVYLHGCNDTTSWDLQWYHDPILSDDPCFVLTPKTFNYVNWCDAWGTGWYPEHTEDMQNTLEVMDSLITAFSIDTNRLYIYGASMGGYGVFSVLAKEPGRFAGAIAMCGGGNPGTADEVAQTPLWIFHGSNDDVVNISESRILYQAIINSGGTQVRFTEYPGVGHNCWDYALQEPAFYMWLLAQEKGTSHGNPDVPENLTGEVLNSSSIQLSWIPPSDRENPDNQIWYYNIFRQNVKIMESDHIDTVYLDEYLTELTSYSYKISSVNLFFKESAYADSLILTTLPDEVSNTLYYTDKFIVTPNPAFSEAIIFLNFEKPVSVALMLYSSNGQLVGKNDYHHFDSGKHQITINLAGLPDGFYMIRLIAGHEIYNARIIIRNQ